MTVFEELINLDRPYIPFKISIGSKEVELQARRLNAADQDAIDAFRSDEYARLVLDYTEAHGDKQSELDRVHQVYLTLTRQELITQLLGTRVYEIQQRAFQLSGIDAAQVGKDITDLEGEAKDLYEKDLADKIKACEITAREELTQEYDSKPDAELAMIMAQVNINIKANNEASIKQNARRLYYTVYDAEQKQFFPSAEAVLQFSRETVLVWLKTVDEAFSKWLARDLPFVLPVAQELNGPQSLPSTSEVDTKTGGEPTPTSQSD